MDIMAGNMVNMASEASETIPAGKSTMAEKEIKYLTDTFDNVRFTGGYSGFYPSTFLDIF